MVTIVCFHCGEVRELRFCGLDGAVLLPVGWAFARDDQGTHRLYCEPCKELARVVA
jgi:hypothetical protein